MWNDDFRGQYSIKFDSFHLVGVDVGVATEKDEQFAVPDELALVKGHGLQTVEVVDAEEGKFLEGDD